MHLPLCQLVSIPVHSFAKYRVHDFGDRRTNGRKNVHVDNTVPPPASLPLRRHKNQNTLQDIHVWNWQFNWQHYSALALPRIVSLTACKLRFCRSAVNVALLQPDDNVSLSVCDVSVSIGLTSSGSRLRAEVPSIGCKNPIDPLTGSHW